MGSKFLPMDRHHSTACVLGGVTLGAIGTLALTHLWGARSKRKPRRSPPSSTAQSDSAVVEVPDRIRRAETVLRHRSSQVLLVLEASIDENNHQAVLRTAEAFGVQHVWILRATEKEMKKREHENARKLNKAAVKWLNVRHFNSLDVLLDELAADDREIWAADVGADAVELHRDCKLQLPERLAIVIGRECDGVSPQMLTACTRKVYIPMFGFSESFNLAVAAGLVLQRLFDLCPTARGKMDNEERQQLRLHWFEQLGATPKVLEAVHDEDIQMDTMDDLRRLEKAVRVPPKFRKEAAQRKEAEAVQDAAPK